MTRLSFQLVRCACLALCLLCLGCEAAPIVASGMGGGSATRPAGPPAPTSAASSDVRVHAVQRIESARQDAVNAAVSLRNGGPDTRTVTVTVVWLSADGAATSPPSVSRKTVTLAPRQAEEVVFEGAPGTRDFKVSLTSPGA